MKHLYFVDPQNINEKEIGFLTPTYGIESVRLALKKLIKIDQTDSNELKKVHYNVISNTAHRIQYLEHLHSQISYHFYCLRKYNKSTICAGILEMSIMSYCILAYSVLEGIGTYHTRYLSGGDQNVQLDHSQWAKQLSLYIAQLDHPESYGMQRARRKRYRNMIDQLKLLRDRVHLDVPLETVDYHLFGLYEFKFVTLILKKIIGQNLSLNEISIVSNN
jgi:hypothetical protein